MSSYITRGGDDGFSGWLGEGRISKSTPRMEALGSIDEATAALGVARGQCLAKEAGGIILRVQQDLYSLMAEVAAAPENAQTFRMIGGEQVAWLEAQIETLAQTVPLPKGFIIPGDCLSAAALDLARAIVRRSERRVVAVFETGELTNADLIRYLNRLSSLIFLLELQEIQISGLEKPTLAKAP